MRSRSSQVALRESCERDAFVEKLARNQKVPLKFTEEVFQVPARQYEIVSLVCEGYSNQEIGELMNLSQSAIASNLRKLYKGIRVGSLSDKPRRKRFVLASLFKHGKIEQD